MRVLILNTDYPAFLDRHYGRNAHLCQASYADQMTARNKSLFGSADFYSRGLAAHGNQAIEIHANNAYLQSAWGREYKLLPVNFLPPPPPTPVADYLRLVGRRLGLPLRKRHRIEPWMQDILKAQIASFRPDVILNQDMYQFTGDFLKNAGSNGMLIVGQIAAALPQHGNYSSYDLIVSSLPNLVAHFRALGIKAERNDLAFDPSVLASLEAPKVRSGAVFIGNFSKDHGRRIALIETLCLQTDKVEVWGGGLAALDRNSPIRARHKGEVYGVEMYRVLASAEIAINIHIDMAERHANNLRLFEATGVGTLLLTDAQDDLSRLFQPDEEVVTFADPDECLDKITYFLAHPEMARSIAERGQFRTLSQHTYNARMGELSELFSRIRKERS